MKMRQVVAMVCVVVAHCAFAALPPECTRLEYIASTGEQYIDTGIKLKCPDDRVYMKFMCTELGNGGVLFGNRKTATDHCFMAHYNNWQQANFAVNINNSSLTRWTNQSSISYLNQMMEIDAQINSITVIRNGTNEYPFVSQLNDTFETIGTCTVLKGVAVEGGTLPNEYGVIGRLYRFEIKRNGVPILDLLPVTTNGVACMYDLVSGKYFGNAGTGAFSAGPELAEDVCSEIWVSTGIETTLLAKPARCFKRWTGDVSQSEESVNPLVWTLSRSVRITPLFHLGFRIDLR